MNRLLILACFLIEWLPVFAISPRVVEKNNSAVAKLKKEANFEAYHKIVEALSLDPLNPVLRQNLGVIYMANKEEDKALSEFGLVVRLSENNPDLKFEGLFNVALVESQKGEIDLALRAYQEALKIKPDSKEVKKNIELLFQNQSQNKKSNSGNKGNNQDEQKQDQSQNNGDNPTEPKQQPENKPKPFDSKELTKEDVRRILEELKNQEQKIRAEIFSKGAKERPNEKDW